MKTLVLGASLNSNRYSNRAVKLLLECKHVVVAIGKDEGNIDDVKIEKDFSAADKIDTVTVYLSKEHQRLYYEKIIAAKPRRIIFNPGAENFELKKLANENGIETEDACTLVLLNTGQY